MRHIPLDNNSINYGNGSKTYPRNQGIKLIPKSIYQYFF